MNARRFLMVCLVLAGTRAVAAEEEMAGWYRFVASGDPAAGEIGMQGWVDAPAGAKGRIVRRGDDLMYDGGPIKLWGLNICFSACAPDKELADRRAAFYPKYGINTVRLHKYMDGTGWAGIQSADSCVEYDPEGLDRMDYQVARFKKAGIYVLLSAHFGSLKVGPADRQVVPYIEEFGSFDQSNRIKTPHSGIHYSPELQELQIRQMVNLLRHRNPYTGLTYAEDPAVAFVEVINEQSILFFTSMNPLKESETLRRNVGRRFCEWLRERYGDQAGLVRAWGAKAVDSFADEGLTDGAEHLDKGNILPLGNPWYWDPVQLDGSQAFRRQRLLDTMEFLYGLQCGFYDRYVRAVREAGYDGEVLGSNWQAGRAFSHYYNLHSDYRVGTIDRHNYFGGGRGKFNNASMLATPGSATLSSGMQQVADRPFMLSEWIHVYPNEWGVEGPAIIGAYGMGLQGWDVSYMFQNRDAGRFSERIGADQWDVTVPQVLGIFPAVARQVLRGDVAESQVEAVRYVSPAAFGQEGLDFEDTTTQQYDVKSFDSDKVPARSLAAVRSVVEFTDGYRPTPRFDPSKYEKDGVITSATGQLRWAAGRSKLDGHFTMDTPGTKAVVGFAEGVKARLGEVTITPKCRYAAIYVTAVEPEGTIAGSRRLLVAAMARARNTGMQFSETEDEVLERGRGPILLEPVRASIEVRRAGPMRVTLLDHDGMRTQRMLPVRDGGFELDGTRDRTPYYLVEF